MPKRSTGFVELGRSFHELATSARASDALDLTEAFLIGPRLHWHDLVKGYRTVILSEAGTGKSEEIRQIAECIRAEGKKAFFLRLEHIPDDFEEAFEVGNFEEFTAWLASTDEGWLLLDSVDEARLRNPGDFERAIRKLGRRIQAATARAHIVITGRTSAWRAKTDLELCERHLPIASDIKKAAAYQPLGDDSLEDALDLETLHTEDAGVRETPSSFRIVALDDLSTSQIEVFARARGVIDTRAFVEDIERADAGSFTARPQDLEELVDFWNKEHRIGTRLELMQNSVQRRLEERDQNRRQSQSLSAVRARDGARLLAAASILAKEPTIQVPDGSYNSRGILVHKVLPNWNDPDQQTLLSRPVFDEAIYGTVRFHHRSVREFLAAEWLDQLLKRPGSRRAVEALLFRVQYGLEVVVPTLRPLLPWLAILDERIRDRILRIAPEVLFEGGDPSALPLSTRKTILADVCKDLASGKSGALDHAAVQRFATLDLTEDIRALLKTYAKNAEIVGFLMRMVWLGRLRGLNDEARALVLSSNTSQYTRTAAMRALRAIAPSEDLDDVRTTLVSEGSVLNREWLSEIVTASSPTSETAIWLLRALNKAAPKQRYTVDSLTDAVASFVETAPIEVLSKLAEGLNQLLEEPPFIERDYCDVSSKNSWLIKPASIAVERLVRERQAVALEEPALGILHKFRAIRNWDDDLREVKAEFGKLIPAWTELNRAAFWYDVRKTRQSSLYAKHGRRLTSFWQASGFSAHWNFDVDDFDYAADAIRTLDNQDDKLVALTLAFDIYAKGNRPPTWRARLRNLARGNAVVEERLEQLLNPPVTEHDREEKKWKKRAAAREKQERDNRIKSKDFILSNIALIRAPELDSPTDISAAQWYLHEYVREKGDRTRWTAGRWRELIPEFGEQVALAYREAVTNYWRKYQPILRSEGAPTNSTPIFVVFGLAGLDIEAAETSNWSSRLSRDEVLLACRYAVHELNGFPPWFPTLFAAYPEIVADFLLSEIRHEVFSENPDAASHNLLADVSSSGQWAWERIAPSVLDLLRTSDISNLFNLGKLLTIAQGSSSVSDKELATLAQLKAKSVADPNASATWFAVWVSVDPDQAVQAVTDHLSSIRNTVDQTRFAMAFITSLLGGRRSATSIVRQKFATPKYLKELFLLMQAYVREDEDIDRSGKGAYSPGLRDNAQDARNALFNQLYQIPGKEAFVALSEIATLHARADARARIASYAEGKAAQDADLAAWSPEQVHDFHEHLRRTPTNHRELADLSIMLLLDLKDDLENGDESVARVLQRVEKEPEMRNFLARELREKALGRYTITQEEQFADDKRPDLRFHGAGFDAPVPTELKLAESWTGPQLFERLEVQLSGDYLRDTRSTRGIFVLVNRTKGRKWQLPSGNLVEFDGLLEALRDHWTSIANKHPHVEDLTIIGIDLSKRFE